jgi:hypothetical protein
VVRWCDWNPVNLTASTWWVSVRRHLQHLGEHPPRRHLQHLPVVARELTGVEVDDPMPGKSTYRRVARSITSSTVMAPAASGAPAADKCSGTPAAGEGSGALSAGEGSDVDDITTSRSPADGGGAESSSEGTITTSVPPEPAPACDSGDAWGRPSPRPFVPPQRRRRSPAGVVRPTPPLQRPRPAPLQPARSGSAHGGWGRGLEGTTRALWARRFRGARLSTPVSAFLREDRSKVNKQHKSENLR